MLILFQEVPGCSTCRNYGNQVLTHPLIVEAAETLFIPVCIYNNKAGKDKEALDIFKEPSWNNPVVRITDNSLNDLSGRISGDYSSYGLVSKIISCLIKTGQKPPIYLTLLEEELKGNFKGAKKARISVSCFWSGEKAYGQLTGVLDTKALYTSRGEAVELSYDPSVTTLTKIVEEGKKQNVANAVENPDDSHLSYSVPTVKFSNIRQDPETKYYLLHSEYRIIPMTPLQAMKINSRLGEGLACEDLLSPRQLHYFKTRHGLKQHCRESQIGNDFTTAWYGCLEETK